MFDHQLQTMVRESEERILHAVHEAEERILAAINNPQARIGLLKLGTPVPQ